MNELRGLNYISIGGQKRPIRFGLNQSRLYCERMGCTLGEYMKTIARITATMENADGSEIPNLIISALMAGHQSAKLEGEALFDMGEVCDWIDEMDQAELSRFFKIFSLQNSPNENGVKTPPAKKSMAGAET